MDAVVSLNFVTGSVPEVRKANMEFFVILTKNEDGNWHCFTAYYLNAYPLNYEESCEERGCQKDESHEDGCPTTGWFYDESNFEYEHCYNKISGEVLAYAPLPSAEDVKASLGMAST